ncbi:MAG TPA: DUF2845 domain-containing protein [Vicinamibacterales bacterium]|nr:DUF2845 domain-containing protein [Vicinamibacterales bacterium]
MLVRWLISAVLGLVVAAAAADDSMRCTTGGIIDVGMIADQVVAKCGQPKSKEVEDVPIRARTAAGGVNVIGTARIERWVYERGYGQFPARLTFEEGKLKTIELLTSSR